MLAKERTRGTGATQPGIGRQSGNYGFRLPDGPGHDSTEITVSGEQEQSAYNGHFESTCYHPLLLFNREGDCLGPSCGRAMRIVPRVGKNCCCPRLRGSRGWAKRSCSAPMRPRQARDLRGAGRAWREVCHPHTRQRHLGTGHRRTAAAPVGRPSHKPVVRYKGFHYQAASWKTARRVVAKVEFHFGSCSLAWDSS